MNGSSFRIVLAVSLLFALIGGCDKVTTATGSTQQPTTNPEDLPQSLPTVKMTIGNREFTIEVADSEPEHTKGMMNRDSNPADHGMIFVFPDEEERGFWMKKTRIPLDIIYITKAGKIVSIRPAQPLDLRTIPSGGSAKYVIELNLGRAAAVGLKPGDTVVIPEGIREPAK